MHDDNHAQDQEALERAVQALVRQTLARGSMQGMFLGLAVLGGAGASSASGARAFWRGR